MARRAVEDEEKVMIGVPLRELLQEYLEASVVHPGQVHTEKLSPLVGSTAAYR
jgi:hypothetical protein